MTTTLPGDLTYGTVTGRFMVALPDAGDAGTNPDAAAGSGSITFTPQVDYLLYGNPEAPTTIYVQPVSCTLDSDGYLVDAQGSRGVTLLATSGSPVSPSGWTWRVSVNLTGHPVRNFSITLPAGTSKDITTSTPAVASTGLQTAVGPEGKSAYLVAVANGFVGDQAAWLTSLHGAKGDPGDDGEDGEDGTDGTDGTDGKSAYEVAVENGFVGSESSWLFSLIGAKGDPGDDAVIGSLADSDITPVAPNVRTGASYTFVLADGFRLVTLSNATLVTLTIPLNSSVAFPLGTMLHWAQDDDGAVQVVGAAGVTVRTPRGDTTAVKYGWVSAIKVNTNEWFVSGDVE